MNRLGLSGRPFIFVVDYKQEQVWVAEPEEVEPREVLYDLNGVTNVTSKAETFPENMLNGRLIRFLLKLTPGLSGQ